MQKGVQMDRIVIIVVVVVIGTTCFFHCEEVKKG